MPKKPVVCKRLKGLMVEYEITVRKLSRKIGISENSLTLKINGHRNWWLWEILSITKQFGFSDARDVFPEIYNFILEME